MIINISIQKDIYFVKKAFLQYTKLSLILSILQVDLLHS